MNRGPPGKAPARNEEALSTLSNQHAQSYFKGTNAPQAPTKKREAPFKPVTSRRLMQSSARTMCASIKMIDISRVGQRGDLQARRTLDEEQDRRR